MSGKPYHVSAPGRCKTAQSKTLRDRFGRPLTIRYTYNGATYVANREQVCNLGGHQVSSNRSFIAENVDDFIWKNLSIWAREFEHMWAAPAQKRQYIKCHALFASFHCSSMFPNCTAEYLDVKPALPCKEDCETTMTECTWGNNFFFLPYQLQCAQYPSRWDHYKKCSRVFATQAYLDRVAAAPPGAGGTAWVTIVAMSLALRHAWMHD